MHDVMTSLPELATDYPPRPLLPTPLTPLVGREAELAALVRQLDARQLRLLTLTGPPGVGKTRLALQAAHQLQAAFADGVYFVSLGSLRDPALVGPAVAQTLGIREEGERPLLDRLRAYLHPQQLLLVLDNFEQILPAAPLVAEILAGCPAVTVLVTSRALLHLRGEHEFPLAPLPVAELALLASGAEQRRSSLETTVEANPAVTLFLQRAQALKPDFVLGEDNLAAVAAICLRLEGLPLSLELAASRIKLLPPAALLARLERRLPLLTGGPQDLPVRQQTLRDTLDWSYDLLEPGTQRLFRLLAVFAGGATLEAATEVAGQIGDQPATVLDRVGSLVDKSLLRVVTTSPTTDDLRLAMLESIREYGLEQLARYGEEAVTRRAHALYYLALAERAEAHLAGKEQQRWLERLEQEHDNLRAALSWLLAEGEVEPALRLGGALWQFWFSRGHMGEGRRWLQATLAQSSEATGPVFAKAAVGAAILSAYLGAYPQAAQWAKQGLEAFRRAGVKPGMAAAFNALVFVSGMQGDELRAKRLAAENVAMCRELAEPGALAYALFYSALAGWLRGDYQPGLTWLEEALPLFQRLGDLRAMASSHYGLGLLLVAQERHDAARPHFEEGMAELRALHDLRSVTMCLAGLADVALGQQDPATAQALAGEAVAVAGEVGDRWFSAYSLDGLAAALAAQGAARPAAQLFGAAAAMRVALGAALPAPRRLTHARYLPPLEATLGPAAFAEAWNEGSRLSFEQVLAVARQVMAVPGAQPAPAPEPSTGPTPLDPAGLTRRELDVLRLVGQGLTDAQVAAQLVISPRTVHSHLASIYGKLGVSSRTAAVRYALDHHLV
jgi:predicted ATPase/DNA-binding CsgD family transcriptional regulator